MKLYSFFLIYFFTNNPVVLTENDDYYKLLGVNRDATVKEIRKAFKILAVKLHPDKNKDDKNADGIFIKLTRAYEVLKDPELRKKYDLYGDSLDSNLFKKQYHSYSYYTDQFGIYDDDPLIVTLSKNDYEVNILDNTQAWFVNFYSPHCHHCHDLAPTWRKLAQELEGVIRIAAVNCEDDISLCRQLRIEAYPSLLYYEKESHLYEGLRYEGYRNLEALKNFVLSKINVDIKDVTKSNWETLGKKQSLLFLCGKGSSCPEQETVVKLAASLDGLMQVGMVKDDKLCEEISKDYRDKPIILWRVIVDENGDSKVAVNSIVGSDSKEILENVLNILPNPGTIDEKRFKEIRASLRNETEKPWLICFFIGAATELNLQLKRLPALLPDINIGLVHCGKSSLLCGSLHVARYPTWGILKIGGAFELHHGRDVLHEITAFAKESVKSVNLHALSPADFSNLLSEGTPWFIDWYAPWCPPCKRLLPELRKASQYFDADQVQFGTIDCTLHRDLCTKYNIRAYPTTIFYNRSQLHHYHGVNDAEGIKDFIFHVMHPIVISLDYNNFNQLSKKPEEELWVVDFFAPWCGPCQRLAPEWRKLSKQLEQFPNVKVAQVDCVANSDLCDAHNIRSYPTIRLYPFGSRGLNSVAIHSGTRDMMSLKQWVLSFFPSSVTPMTSNEFENKVLNKSPKVPVLVKFYAPWCGHCINFEPEFNMVAKKLEGVVKCVKIDCETERIFCGRQGIKGYPTVRLYLSSGEHYGIDTHNANQIIYRVKEIIDDKQKHDEL